MEETWLEEKWVGEGALERIGKREIVGERNRIFIPLVMATSPQEINEIVFRNTKQVAFNYYEIRLNKKVYSIVKTRGIKDAFDIPEDVDVFLLTTEKDEIIKRLLLDGDFSVFKQDIKDFEPDFFMGPDFWNYREMNNDENEEMVNVSTTFNLQCSDLDGLIPNIPGITLKQKMDFVDIFKAQGFDTFIQPGRESLINLAGRKKDEQILAYQVFGLKKLKKIKILITGCSSPRQQKLLYGANGFFGLGYLIDAMIRVLIQDDKFKWILKDNTNFFCDNEKCCNSLPPSILAKEENDWRRVLHNLFENQRGVNEKTRFTQTYLVI
jgi:hypothetical protein